MGCELYVKQIRQGEMVPLVPDWRSFMGCSLAGRGGRVSVHQDSTGCVCAAVFSCRPSLWGPSQLWLVPSPYCRELKLLSPFLAPRPLSPNTFEVLRRV